MNLKSYTISLFTIIFFTILMIVTVCPVHAQNNNTDSLDIIIKISKIDETLSILEDLIQPNREANAPSPVNMFKGMLQGTEWIDHNRPVVVGVVLNSDKPEIAALIPFKEQNNNFQAAFNAVPGHDYYIIPVPPVPNGYVSEPLKNTLVDLSRSESGDSLSITMNVSKIMAAYYDKIKESLLQLENMPENQELKKLNMQPSDIREMLQKAIDTLSEVKAISAGLNLDKSSFRTFFKADTIQGSELEKLFTLTGNTSTLLDTYSPQYQINFRTRSYDIPGMINIIHNCFGNFYKKAGIDLAGITSICPNFTGEMAGGINFESGGIIFESISVLQKGKSYADFIEKTYLPWLEKYNIDTNKMLSKHMPAGQRQNLTRTPDSIVNGLKVYGIKANIPFVPIPGPDAVNSVPRDKKMFEYDMRITVLDNLLITAPNDKRIAELIQTAGSFEEKKSASPLMTMNIDVAGYIKMIIGMAAAQGVQIGEPPEMGSMDLECDASNGTVYIKSSLMTDDVKKMTAWIKGIDFSRIRYASSKAQHPASGADGHLKQAAHYKKTSAINDNESQYWLDKGALCATYGNDNAAIKYYQKAVKIDPGRFEAYFQMGISYGEIGDYPKAISLINKALETDPKNSLYLYGRGRVYLLSGDKQKGMDDMKLAAALGNRDAHDYLQSRAPVQN